LTSITGANVTGTVANATYAITANASSFAGTVTTNAQPNITSVGLLTAVSASGNISTTGNITGNYHIGNGSLLTGIVSSYGNANVTTLLAALGSNTISSTGNITTTANIAGNYILGNGSQLSGLPATYANANVATFLANFGSNTISTTGTINSGNIAITGGGNIAVGTVVITNNNGAPATLNIAAAQLTLGSGGNLVVQGVITGSSTGAVTGSFTGGNLFSQGVITATGNITGNYFIGNGSALTGITATASPGGANTQLQFNNAGSLAGNSNMTFDVTSGNVVVGNIYYNGLNIVPGGQGPNVLPTGNTNPSRLVIGQGYNGNLNWAFNQNTPGFPNGSGPGARVLISDTYNYSSSSGATRLMPLTLQNYVVLTANVSGSNAVAQGAFFSTMIGGGASANTGYVNSTSAFTGLSVNPIVGYTQNANLSAVGNTSVSFVLGIRTGPTVNYGSNADVVMGVISAPAYTNNGTTVFANIGNVAAYTTAFSGSSANANVIQTAAAVGYYHPGPTITNTILQSPTVGASVQTGNIPRMATSYYAFRNDDDLAMSKLGSLSQFHEYSYGNNSTTGSITINKANGQVQYIPLTGSLTISGFSNFVTSVTKPNASVNYQTM
jgi:hypothetical protein